MSVIVRNLLRIAGVAAALALTGCLGGSTEPVPVSGIYDLKTINGAALPYTFTNGVQIAKETFTVFKDGTFTDVTTRGDGTVISDAGLYANFGGTLNFSDQTAGLVYQGFVTGTELAIKIGSFNSIYQKTADVSH